LAAVLRQELPDLPHVAPWLHNPGDGADNTFSIFATRQEQIAYAIKSLSCHGRAGSRRRVWQHRNRRTYREDVERAATELKLKVRTYAPTTTLDSLATTPMPKARAS